MSKGLMSEGLVSEGLKSKGLKVWCLKVLSERSGDPDRSVGTVLQSKYLTFNS